MERRSPPATGRPLVMGSQSFILQTTTGSDGFQQVLDLQGNNITSSIQGGQLGGAIQIRDQTIPSYLNQLNTLASQFATAFNAAQAQGFDSNGNTGAELLHRSFGHRRRRGRHQRRDHQSCPDRRQLRRLGGQQRQRRQSVRSADQRSAVRPNAAQCLRKSRLSSGQCRLQCQHQSSAIGQNLLQLTNQQSSVSGVSIDEETTNLIRYQTAYEAAARIVSTSPGTQHRDPRHGLEPELLIPMRVNPNLVPDILADSSAEPDRR